MITFSAFADEIGPDLDLQMETCAANGIKCIDVRGIDGKNVSEFTLEETREYRKRLDGRGFTVPCVGSPLGKIRISDDFDAHLELLKHCIEIADAFGTDCIRVFSFYPSDGRRIEDQRDAVMDRLAKMVKVAEAAQVTLYHENEKAIYGAKPAGVADIFDTIDSPNLLGVFDPANFVEEGIRPYDEGWTEGLSALTQYFHVKDKVADPAAESCCPAGEGAGQFREIFADMVTREWSGFMTLEPHLSQAGQFAGFTGAEKFKAAVDAVKALCDEAGLDYDK